MKNERLQQDGHGANLKRATHARKEERVKIMEQNAWPGEQSAAFTLPLTLHTHSYGVVLGVLSRERETIELCYPPLGTPREL